MCSHLRPWSLFSCSSLASEVPWSLARFASAAPRDTEIAAGGGSIRILTGVLARPLRVVPYSVYGSDARKGASRASASPALARILVPAELVTHLSSTSPDR